VLTTIALAALVSFGPPGEDLPAGTGGAKGPASAGATDVTEEGKFKTTGTDGSNLGDMEKGDLLEMNASAGGILNTGNANSAAITTTGTLGLHKKRHKLGVAIAGNYGASKVDDGKWKDTAGNVQGRLRYEVFWLKRAVAYMQSTARHDPFQGLDLRLNVGPGLGYYFLAKDTHRLWAEAGYDFQLDLRRFEDRVSVNADTGEFEILDRTAYRHAARVYVGYINRLSDKVTFDTGLEYLQGLVDPAQIRLNWDVGLSTQLFDRLSLATTFTLRFDNDPLPGIKKVDTVTALSIVYRFF
jgi:putative salt-induced outer membrane protein